MYPNKTWNFNKKKNLKRQTKKIFWWITFIMSLKIYFLNGKVINFKTWIFKHMPKSVILISLNIQIKCLSKCTYNCYDCLWFHIFFKMALVSVLTQIIVFNFFFIKRVNCIQKLSVSCSISNKICHIAIPVCFFRNGLECLKFKRWIWCFLLNYHSLLLPPHIYIVDILYQNYTPFTYTFYIYKEK